MLSVGLPIVAIHLLLHQKRFNLYEQRSSGGVEDYDTSRTP